MIRLAQLLIIFIKETEFVNAQKPKPLKEYVCKDKLPPGECEKFKDLCKLTLHSYNCQKTCGLCEGDPLRPINTVGICYRDSPCNEDGTDGGNADGCILTEEYPFFRCKCKQYYDGWRCQWYNCPCQNGGNCLECQEINGVACRDNPVCTCQKGFKGKFCEIKIENFYPIAYGPWSEWSIPDCTGNDGKTSTRKRWCTDGSTFKNPKCCQGRESFCKTTENTAEVETKICPVNAYWSKWSEWAGCTGQKYEVRRRKCVAGKAGVSPGCTGTPQRKERRLCPKIGSRSGGFTPFDKVTEAPEKTTYPMQNDVGLSLPTEEPEIQETTTHFGVPLGITKDPRMVRAMKNKPVAPLPPQSEPLNPMNFMGGGMQMPMTVNGSGVNAHFYFQCFPQCLGNKKPFLCIVPQWCAANYDGQRSFWMW
ncbi:Oidioi.mRNA.OKI2018_I69.chr2.g7241.t1.cds [Oikopleura dioica]|uniref:Oidioi.mRNA.OKI2018_I69.chr2.g7241.t1.cds n=1 Tax=Oikopleura dioica TaxID=34765 RepID=A0ABN7TC25_OIKDI|nr:Oidioi.mRNA.OKI2018_I69.chr2.g7241.t1.cds [Oikopleura dioica]